MYGQYPDLDSTSLSIGPAASPTFAVSDARARSVTMNDSDGRSTDGPCGYPSVTCRAAAQFGCRGARRVLMTDLRVVSRRLGVLGAPQDCGQ